MTVLDKPSPSEIRRARSNNPKMRERDLAIELGISYLTIYSFSSENWARPAEEVNDLGEAFEVVTQAGDLVAQIHPIAIPAETVPGSFQAIVGIYDRLSGTRLPVLVDGEVVGDFTAVFPLEIGQ